MRRNTLRFFIALLVAVFSFSLMQAVPARAATRTASVSGSWNSTATWGGSSIPVAGDAVVINSGVMVTIPSGYAAAATSVTINTNALGTQNGLTFADSTSSLALTGAITMNAANASPGSLFALDAGTLSGATTLEIPGSGTSGRNTTFRISTGTADFSGSITFSGTAGQAQFTFTGAGRLNIGGNFGSGGTLTGGTGTINFNGAASQTIGTYTTYKNIEINNTSGGVTLLGTTTFGGTLTITTGTFTVAGYTLTVTGTTTVNGNLNFASSTTGTKTFTGDVTISSGGTLNFTTSETIALSSSLIIGDGTITGTSTGTINVAGNLTVPAGTTATIRRSTITVTGNTTVDGTLTFSSTSGTKTFVGLVIIDSGGTWNNSINEAIAFRGGITHNGSAFTSGTGTYTFSTNSQAISGSSAITFGGNVAISGAITLTNNNSNIVTITGSLTGSVASSTWFNDTGAYTQFGNVVLTTGTLTTSSSTNTILYNRANTQTVKGTTYYNLTLAGTNTKTLGAATTVNGDLTVNSGSTLNSSSFQLTLLGNFVVDGTFTAGTGTVTYNGTTQTIAPVTYNNLTINQSSGNATLNGNATVNEVLTLTSGNLVVTDPYALTMGASATTIGATDVTGVVKRTTLLAGTSYSFGNQYTTVTFNDANGIPTELSINISIGAAPSWKTGAIQRYYNIVRTGGNSSSLATVQLHYLDSELNGNSENNLTTNDYHVSQNKTDEHGESNRDITNNWVSLSNLRTTYLAQTSWGTRFWTLADSTAVSNTWLGADSTNWTDIANWSFGAVPLATDNVTIPDAATSDFDPTLNATTTINTLTLQTGAILNAPASSILTIAGNSSAWCNDGGTFNPGTGTVIFTGATATISGTNNFYNVTINSGAGLTPENDSIMRISGTVTNSGTWRAGLLHNTVEYNGGDQTVLNPNGPIPGYCILILSGSGTKTMPDTSLNLVMDFSMSGTASATANAAINITGSFAIGSGSSFTTGAYTHAIGGNFSNNGTFTATGSTITLNGTSAQVMSGATTFNNLTLNNSSGLILSDNETVNGILTLTSGNIATGNNTVIVGSSGSISRTSGHVIGNLQKYVATGATTITFEVGEVANYDPVTVTFANVSVAGNLTAKVTDGEHPNIASANINPSMDVNDYWTLTNSGIIFDSYNATFTFAPGDVDASANASFFILGIYGGGWTYPSIGMRTATSIQVTGVTSFSDFVVGEILPTWVSYNDAAHTVPDNMFEINENTVYMFGQNFRADYIYYVVAYYDGNTTDGGQKVDTETGLISGASGNLSSQCILTTDPNAVAGIWHAVVFDTALGDPPNLYNDVAAAPGYIVEDSFEVTSSAIPELPTVIAAIAMAGLCVSAYCWLRKRRLAYVSF